MAWSPFHTRMVFGLGAAWVLDGLQITISSSVTGVLTQPATLGMSSTEIGLIASIYLVGEVFGALIFGRLSDQLGRKRLLIVTLLLYLCGTGLAAVPSPGRSVPARRATAVRAEASACRGGRSGWRSTPRPSTPSRANRRSSRSSRRAGATRRSQSAS
jgi:hypothetical protein